MTEIAIINGHPQRGVYCEALVDAYRQGAEAAGHRVQVLHLAAMQFDPILREGYRAVQPLEPDLESALAAVKRAEHLVFVFPLYLGDMPALLKAFLERLMQPSLIEAQKAAVLGKVIDSGGMPKSADVMKARGTLLGWQPLGRKSARIVMTMGMPALVYRIWFGSHAIRLFRRSILHFIGIKPVRTTLLGLVANADDARRQRWLKDMAALGAKAG